MKRQDAVLGDAMIVYVVGDGPLEEVVVVLREGIRGETNLACEVPKLFPGSSVIFRSAKRL